MENKNENEVEIMKIVVDKKEMAIRVYSKAGFLSKKENLKVDKLMAKVGKIIGDGLFKKKVDDSFTTIKNIIRNIFEGRKTLKKLGVKLNDQAKEEFMDIFSIKESVDWSKMTVDGEYLRYDGQIICEVSKVV